MASDYTVSDQFKRALDATGITRPPSLAFWIGTDESGVIELSMTRPRDGVSRPERSQKVLSLLQEAGIEARIKVGPECGSKLGEPIFSESILIDSKQPNFAAKVQEFQTIHHDEILNMLLAGRSHYGIGVAPVPSSNADLYIPAYQATLDKLLPINPDGSLFDPEDAAEVLATLRAMAERTAKKYGITNMVEAIAKPRSGRSLGRTSDERSSD